MWFMVTRLVAWAGLLPRAAREGDTTLVKIYVRLGADVNQTYQSEYKAPAYSVLHYAVMSGNDELVNFLLDSGADPNIEARFFRVGTPLLEAIRRGDKAILRDLLDSGADPNKDGTKDVTNALVLAYRHRQFELAEILLNHGADPTGYHSNRGQYVLNAVAGTGNREHIRRVVAEIVDAHNERHPEKRITDSSSIDGLSDYISDHNLVIDMDSLRQMSQSQTFAILVQYSHPEAWNLARENPQYVPAILNIPQIIEPLTQLGWSFFDQGPDELSPFAYAIQRGNFESIEAVENRLRTEGVPRIEGMTAADFARKNDQTTIAEYLERFEEATVDD